MTLVTNGLLEAIEASDAARASELFRQKIAQGRDPWTIHASLFPVVQRVMNPPFINPHLPKMYRINRELVQYLDEADIPALVNLEIHEYARRAKLEKLPKAPLLSTPVAFSQVESAIRDQDWQKAAAAMATMYAQEGRAELARRLLLLGSGYLDNSLGHSVSCTAFILLEMLEREDQDPWPALATLADYFCKGRFSPTPLLRTPPAPLPATAIADHMLRAASGRGIVNLHHTITLYSIERVRQFFNQEEYNHLIGAWIAFMGDKKADPLTVDGSGKESRGEYSEFSDVFSRQEAKSSVAYLAGMLGTPAARRKIGRFLVKGVCGLYQGDYNPHYLTGLGSALWVVDRYGEQRPIMLTALYQYVDFFFSGLKSRG